MTTCLKKSCSFGLPHVPFIHCCQFMYFGFETRMWDLIVSVPDHCLSFHFSIKPSLLFSNFGCCISKGNLFRLFRDQNSCRCVV